MNVKAPSLSRIQEHVRAQMQFRCHGIVHVDLIRECEGPLYQLSSCRNLRAKTIPSVAQKLCATICVFLHVNNQNELNSTNQKLLLDRIHHM